MERNAERPNRTHPLRFLLAASALVMAIALFAGLAHAKKVDTGGAGAVGNTLVSGGAVAAPVSPVSVADPPLPGKTKVVTIDGAKGGSICLGRFTLDVPAGAWYGTGTVTVTIPDESKVMCDLSITPASLNGFNMPLTLRMKTTGCDTTDPLLPGYWDPAFGKWTHIPGGYQEAGSKDVIAPLYHFSRYGALGGKAGW